MIEYYRNKKSPVKEYILACYNYVSELKGLEVIEIFTELEYERSFIQLLSLVKENYRPDHFISCTSDSFIRIFEDEFIVYVLSVSKQFKKLITWNQLCQLEYNFSMLKIRFDVKTGFREDFLPFAIRNIKLLELWTLKN
ncbi:MAG TPA: hypothetical protein VIK55_06555 [Paludibacter sp.]